MPINVIVFFPIIKVTVDDSRLHKDINRSEEQTENKVYQLFYKFSSENYKQQQSRKGL